MEIPVGEIVAGISAVLTSGGVLAYVVKGQTKEIDKKVDANICTIKNKHITQELTKGDKKFEKVMDKLDTHLELLTELKTNVETIKEHMD